MPFQAQHQYNPSHCIGAWQVCPSEKHLTSQARPCNFAKFLHSSMLQCPAASLAESESCHLLSQFKMKASSLHPHAFNACLPSTILMSVWSVVMEYAAGGDMFQRVKACGGLKEDDARWFFQQLIIGLDYCHKVYSGSCMLVEHMLRG